MKNKRKILALLLVVMLLLGLSVPSFAAVDDSVALQVAQANTRVGILIADAQCKAVQAYDVLMQRVKAENDLVRMNPSQGYVSKCRIADYWNEYTRRIDDIGNNLVAAAANISREMDNLESISGVRIDCYNVQVRLGNKVFLVDPFRIVG